MKLPANLSHTKKIIYKTSILWGALFFIISQLCGQDTLRPVKAAHTMPDSNLVAKKRLAATSDTSTEALVNVKKTGADNKPAKKKWTPVPERATILSAVLPGLGQAYNRKYWKIPIIYATGGVLYYYYYINHEEYIYNKEQYLLEKAKGDAKDATAMERYQNIFQEKRKKSEYKLMLIGVLYVANVVDAMADAYFTSYNISDDLSLKIKPSLLPEPCLSSSNFSYGITLSLNFK